MTETTSWEFFEDGVKVPCDEKTLRDYTESLSIYSDGQGLACSVMRQMWDEIDRLRKTVDPLKPLLTSEPDEALMRETLAKCYGTKTIGFRVSAEHYRYLAEQVVALREAQRRARTQRDGR